MSMEGDRKIDVHSTSGAENLHNINAGDTSDIGRLIEIDKAASQMFMPTGLLNDEALSDHVPAESFRKAIRSGGLLVARLRSGEAIGFVMATRLGGELYVDQISVDPLHGRRGAGRALMCQMEERASARHLPALTLSTFRDLEWNAPFYASLGYKELERAAFAPYMFEIEAAQKPYMDVSKRIFMRKRLRKSSNHARTRT